MRLYLCIHWRLGLGVRGSLGDGMTAPAIVLGRDQLNSVALAFTNGTAESAPAVVSYAGRCNQSKRGSKYGNGSVPSLSILGPPVDCGLGLALSRE
jgi:hypothetical protein